MTPGMHAAERLTAEAAAVGLASVGRVNGPLATAEGMADLVLLGWRDPGGWAHFESAPEAKDGRPEPLDRWTRRVGDALAASMGATALYPFGGPPWSPFIAWAAATGRTVSSPVGLLADGERGLWISYRLALGFPAPLGGSPPPPPPPCGDCVDQPCRTACPAGALGPEGYDIARCAAHIRSDAGADCVALGCRVRAACPVGQDFAPTSPQARHHMTAFLRSR